MIQTRSMEPHTRVVVGSPACCGRVLASGARAGEGLSTSYPQTRQGCAGRGCWSWMKPTWQNRSVLEESLRGNKFLSSREPFLGSRIQPKCHNHHEEGADQGHWRRCSGVEVVRSEQVHVRPTLPTVASLDKELGGAHMEAAPELNCQPDRRRWRYVWLLIPTAISAVTLAVIWPNNVLQLWSFAQSLISFSAQQTASGDTSGSPGALVALGALKDEISELRYGQQKIIAELRSAQQELQLSSVKTTYWYSEPNALLHQQVASKPTAAAVRNNKPSAQPRPLQEVNAEPRNGTVPLPLARSQTTAPDAVPIR